MTTTNKYVKHTVNWEYGEKPQLLAVNVIPHVEVSNSTVAQSIKKLLNYLEYVLPILKCIMQGQCHFQRQEV